MQVEAVTNDSKFCCEINYLPPSKVDSHGLYFLPTDYVKPENSAIL